MRNSGYVDEWVNLGAGAHTSDLRNDYGRVAVTVAGQRVDTGLTKVGTCIGDHTKTGLGVLLNTGSNVGAFCNLLPSGSLLPRAIPSFCVSGPGWLREGTDINELVETAGRVMRRRGQTLSGVQAAYFRQLYYATAGMRWQALLERGGAPRQAI